jgi:YggT family protein
VFIVANLLLAIAHILNIVLSAYIWLIIISALLSWVNPDPYNPIVRFLHAVTEPVLIPIRRIIGFRLGVIDISPIIAILGIMFIKYFLVASFVEFAYKLKRGGII